MKKINTERLEPGDKILAFDSNLCKWFKCKIIQVEKYLVTLKDVEGSLKGIRWFETIERLKNPNYYRSVKYNKKKLWKRFIITLKDFMDMIRNVLFILTIQIQTKF